MPQPYSHVGVEMTVEVHLDDDVDVLLVVRIGLVIGLLVVEGLVVGS